MEIERKFLLRNENWRKEVKYSIKIKQGYICSDPDRVIRIRITDSKAFITIKGKGTDISRPEYEYEIPQKEAEEMYSLFCQNSCLEKTRHIIDYKNHKWEIDEFAGVNEGLVVAEVELQEESEHVELPAWIGNEVTGDPQYYNSNLVNRSKNTLYYSEFKSKKTDLEKCLYLYDLHHQNPNQFFDFAKEHTTEFLPILYTPTIGDAVINYSKNYKYPLGLIISYNDKGHIKDILEHRKKGFGKKEMTIAVVTDGEGVLGIGDQGVGAIYISLGKLMVYSLCGNLDQSSTLPIMLDVGTNNQKLIDDPEYKGWRHSRISGQEYYEFIDEFVKAFSEVFPNSFLHWEDFGKENAKPVLDKYREFHPSFNDDIQGTGVVALAAVLSGIKKSEIPLENHKICIFGAGTAGCGIANQICKGLAIQMGITPKEAAKKFFLIDKNGLLQENDKNLLYFQKDFAKSSLELTNWQVNNPQNISLHEVIKNAKPTILIGCSTVSGAFTNDIISEMYSYTKKPIIMPISNPTSKAEATPDRLLAQTEGNALIATGSPFGTIEFNNKKIKISQCNNALAFPGIGIGMVKSKTRILTDKMLLKASEVLAKESEKNTDKNGLLPSFDNVLQISELIVQAINQQK